MSQKVLTIVILQDRMTTVNDKYHLHSYVEVAIYEKKRQIFLSKFVINCAGFYRRPDYVCIYDQLCVDLFYRLLGTQ